MHRLLQAADVVLAADRLAEAMRISRRSRAIALQSVLAGMSLPLVAMLVAAGGWLVPVAGAVVQEAIDMAVILNALRALGERWRAPAQPPRPLAETAAQLRQEHSDLAPWLDGIRGVADRLQANGPVPDPRSGGACRLPGGAAPPPRATGRRTSRRRTRGPPRRREPPRRGALDPSGDHPPDRRYRRLVDSLPPSGPTAEDVLDLRRTLYGLDAILRPHNAQEDELYDWLWSAAPASPQPGAAPIG